MGHRTHGAQQAQFTHAGDNANIVVEILIYPGVEILFDPVVEILLHPRMDTSLACKLTMVHLNVVVYIGLWLM